MECSARRWLGCLADSLAISRSPGLGRSDCLRHLRPLPQVVGSADNVLRPILIGGKSSLSGLLIAFGAMGGMAAFGLIGAVAGPFALAAIVIILGNWQEEE